MTRPPRVASDAQMLVHILDEMDTVESRAAAREALQRWEASYENDPHKRDAYVGLAIESWWKTFGPPGAELPPGAGRPELRSETPTTAPLASTPAASTVETSSPSLALLWTCAAAAVALLVGLVVFWKRSRPS